MSRIVVINVTQTVAPAPETLQQAGALVSCGGTTLAAGASALLTQLSDLTPLQPAGKSISSIVWSGGTVTVTSASPHGYTISDTVSISISGVLPAGYDGTFLCTITGASTFTYPLVSNPGAETTLGSFGVANISELLAMATTYFAQGDTNAVYVLELGPLGVTLSIAALSAYITANPNTVYDAGAEGFYYAYLIPKEWDANSSFLALTAEYESPSAKTYFFVTTTTASYTSYTPLMKCVIALIQAPGTPSTEFSAAAAFYAWLNYAPSAVNLVTPFCYSYAYGVTQWPTYNNNALLTTITAAGVNYFGAGSEGGISDTILFNGTTMDGHDATYWYSADWVQLNSDELLANAVINGSNNSQNPLDYDQDGINRLQAVEVGVMKNAVTFGLANPNAAITINAIPFAAYVLQNPTDYEAGIYRGLSVSYTPQRGFKQLVFNLNVDAFPAQG